MACQRAVTRIVSVAQEYPFAWAIIVSAQSGRVPDVLIHGIQLEEREFGGGDNPAVLN
jgi:hypothetical protein